MQDMTNINNSEEAPLWRKMSVSPSGFLVGFWTRAAAAAVGRFVGGSVVSLLALSATNTRPRASPGGRAAGAVRRGRYAVLGLSGPQKQNSEVETDRRVSV